MTRSAMLVGAALFFVALPLRAEPEAKSGEHGPVDPEIFAEARRDFDAERFADAAAGFYGVMRLGGASHPDYEWSRYYLGESLRGLDLHYAATQYLARVVASGAQPAAIPRGLARLQTIAQRDAFDADLIFDELIHDRELGALPPAQRDFVAYAQGWVDLRAGDRRWAERHFARLDPAGTHAAKAALALAADALSRGDDSDAQARLEALLDEKRPGGPAGGDAALRNEAWLALARLHYEANRHEAAWNAYARVEQLELTRGQALLLLEKAWTAYALGRHAKAMGLLHALRAPSYRDYFQPDAYFLRALIFKELCHYLPAKRELRRFRATYERILGSLKKRIPLSRIAGLRRAATEEGGLAVRTALIREMGDERRRIEDHDSAWEDIGLDEHLRSLYDIGRQEQLRRWRRDYDNEGRRIANGLLDLEAQVALLDHEIDLDLFRRVELSADAKLPSLLLEIPFDSARSYYEFDGEFWNDELHEYRYFISNRCFGEGTP